MTLAIEEFLRAYAPVRTMAREVVKQTQISGCTFKPGHMVLLFFSRSEPRSHCLPECGQGDY